MGDSNYIFGTIADAIVMDGGDIAVLDEAAGCARLYDDTRGSFIIQVSRAVQRAGLSSQTVQIILPAVHRLQMELSIYQFMTGPVSLGTGLKYTL